VYTEEDKRKYKGILLAVRSVPFPDDEPA